MSSKKTIRVTITPHPDQPRRFQWSADDPGPGPHLTSVHAYARRYNARLGAARKLKNWTATGWTIEYVNG